jgi:hypothetical protein
MSYQFSAKLGDYADKLESKFKERYKEIFPASESIHLLYQRRSSTQNVYYR